MVTSQLQLLMDTVKILLLLCYEVVQLRHDFKFQAQMCSLQRLTVPNLTSFHLLKKIIAAIFIEAVYYLVSLIESNLLHLTKDIQLATVDLVTSNPDAKNLLFNSCLSFKKRTKNYDFLVVILDRSGTENLHTSKVVVAKLDN